MNSPRPHVPKMQASWWLQRPSYIRYMLREVTSAWILAYVILLVVGLLCLSIGAEAWQGFVNALASPTGIVFQLLSLAFAAYHSISWFRLAPSTMPVWRGEERVPPLLIEVAHYVVWIVVSAAILLLGGA